MVISPKHFGLAGVVALLGVASYVVAQSGTQASTKGTIPADPSYGDLHLSTRIGSFKMIDGVGTVEMSFTGTVLLSQVKGGVTPSGNLRKEYDEKGKQTYHGTGKIVVKGPFRAIQWFGTDMQARWVGRGVARIQGEFDQNLETGYYWYGNKPNEKVPWSMYGMTLLNPKQQVAGSATPVERKSGGG